MADAMFEKYLKDHGIDSEFAQEKMGLKIRHSNIYGMQVVFPITDLSGNFIFNKYRNLEYEPGGKIPKFVYDPGNHTQLYNYFPNKDKDYIFIFEGEPDVIKATQDGIPAVSVTSGALTMNAELAAPLQLKKVFICYDNDKAGGSGLKKVLRFLPNASPIKLPTDVKDYCEYRGKYSLEHFRNLAIEAKKAKDNSHNSQVKKEVNWPISISDAAYYGLAGEIVKLIEPHSEADPVALLVNFLTGIGSIIGNKPHFKVEADKHPTRFFIVLVGKTSKARKGTSWGYILKILELVDPDWVQKIQTGLSSGEGLIWAVRDKIMKLNPVKKAGRTVDYEDIIEDPGVTDKRLLIVETEFAGTLRILGREGNTLSAVIRNAWDSGNLQTLTKNSPARSNGAHVSIIGHIPTDELLHYLTKTEAANGFGNRYLWFCVKRSKALPFGSNFSDSDLTSIADKLKQVIEFCAEVDEITWAEETRPLWAEIYPELSEGKLGLVGSMTARAEAYVVRLSVVYALLDKSEQIRPEHLHAALAVWKYAEDSVRSIFKERTGDLLADAIFTALIENPDGLDRTAISDLFNGHKSSDEIFASLDLLANLGLATSQFETTDGRDREIWFVVIDNR